MTEITNVESLVQEVKFYQNVYYLLVISSAFIEVVSDVSHIYTTDPNQSVSALPPLTHLP